MRQWWALCNNKGCWVSWAAISRSSWTDGEKWFFPSAQCLLNTCGAESRPGLSSTREMRTYWREFSKEPQRWLMAWSVWHTKRGWERQDCPAWRRSGLGCLSSAWEYLMERNEDKTDSLVVPSGRTSGSWRKVHQIPSEHKRALLHCEVDQTLEGRGVECPSLGILQSCFTVHSPRQSAWTGVFGIGCFQRSFPTSATLWFWNIPL